MKRIGILTAVGDTPAPNARLAGAVMRANRLNAINTVVQKRSRCLETEAA